MKISKSPFKFKCEAGRLHLAISNVESVTAKLSSSGEFEKRYFIVADKEKQTIFVVGYSSDTFIAIKIAEVGISASGIFSFEPKLLLGVIKGRATLNFKFDSNKLSFAAVEGKYAGTIETVSVSDDNIVFITTKLPTRKKAAMLPPGVLARIRDGLKLVDIKDHYNNERIICNIRLTNSTLDISAYDNFHMAYYKTQVEADGEFALSIPIEAFKIVDRFLSDGEEAKQKFYITSKELRIITPSMILSLPPVQSSTASFDAVPTYLKDLPAHSVEIPFTQDAIKTTDNMFTLASDETKLSLNIDKNKKVSFSLITGQGKIYDEFELSGVKSKGETFSAYIDPRIFDDLFKKVSSIQKVFVRFYQKKNQGVSSGFVISASNDTAKAFLVGTYNETEK